MKYIAILLILSSFGLVSCFEKKDVTLEDENTQENIVGEQDSVGSEDFFDSEAQTGVTETQEVGEETDNTIPSTQNSSSSNETNLSASGGTKTEEEIVQEFEDDLDDLFNDLLKGE